MFDLELTGSGRSSAAHAEVQKAFDIRAKGLLELELRLDRFNDAVAARGGRVLTVSRWRAASGGYFAAVRYSIPLPRGVAPGSSRIDAPRPSETRIQHRA